MSVTLCHKVSFDEILTREARKIKKMKFPYILGDKRLTIVYIVCHFSTSPSAAAIFEKTGPANRASNRLMVRSLHRDLMGAAGMGRRGRPQ